MSVKQRALSILRERSLTYAVGCDGWGRTEIEVLPPCGFLFDDGGAGISGLVCTDWKDVISRVKSGEAVLVAEEEE